MENKKEILYKVKCNYKLALQNRLNAINLAFKYLKTHRYKSHTVIGKEVYKINNCICLCTYMNMCDAELEFTPISSEGDLGTGVCGGVLRIDFNNVKQ